MNPVIKKIVVLGSTSWDSYEYQMVQRYGGDQLRLIRSRDPSGKWVKKAFRRVCVTIVCADGVVYESSIAADNLACDTDTIMKRILMTVRVHDMDLLLYKEEYPNAIRMGMRRTVRRLMACYKVIGGAYNSMPKYKPVPKGTTAWRRGSK